MNAKLSDEDAELALDPRDLEELNLLNFFIILLLVTENNHNLILNKFKWFSEQGLPQVDKHETYTSFALKHNYLGWPSRSQKIQFELTQWL